MKGVITICFYGPESTGKSTMARHMAFRYATEFVPEVAREMVTTNDFSVDEIVEIGYAQTKRVKEKLMTANKILFCDSDLITTQIYSQHYLHTIPQVLFELEKEIMYDAYFFFDIDTAWVADGLRDQGDVLQREHMKTVFLRELEKRKITYYLLQGSWQAKEEKIAQFIDQRWGIAAKK